MIRKFEEWVKEHLGVRLEIVKHPWTGMRGVWAPAGVKVDWDQIIVRHVTACGITHNGTSIGEGCGRSCDLP